LWLLAGLRRVGEEQFGVLACTLAPRWARLVEPGFVLAPPGLLRLEVYPEHGLELPLPSADRAMLRGVDGSRYGFRGWITLRPRKDDWRKLHEASGGRGIVFALVSSIQEAAGKLRPGSERAPDAATLERELGTALGASLESRGLILRGLALEGVDFLAAPESGGEPAATEAKLLVVGFDGLDWEIVDDLLARGRMPNLRGLIERGTRAKLLTISPMLSPVIWTTIATGVEPSRHGILDFLVQDPSGSRQPVTSAQRRVPTVWELLSRAGIEVGVTGWWASWPADAVRGYLVSDRIAYQLFGFRADPDDPQGKTWPPELYARIRPHIATPDTVKWEEVQAYLAGPRRERDQFDGEERRLLDEFRTLLASSATYLTIAEDLRHEYRPSLEVAYFEGTDTVGHLFMPYRPPALAGVDPRRIESFGEIVDRYYDTADEYLGRLLRDRGPEWTVMVLSDHGFASDATRPRSTDSRVGHGAAADWHRRFGVLVLSGAHARSDVRLEEASVWDIAPTILALFGQAVPRSWPGRVLGGALEESFLDAHPVRYRREDPARAERVAEGLVDPAAADLLEKLESLGYVSPAGTGAEAVTARNNAGVALLAEGRYDDAEREFRAGLVAAPGSPMLSLNLAVTLRLAGRDAEAEQLFRSCLDHPMTRRMAGHLLAQMHLDRGELPQARALLERVLQVEPDAAEVRSTLGQVLEREGRIEEAKAEYTRAVDLDPDAALPRNSLGNLARRDGDLDAAESWYTRAIEADPYFMGAYNNLALVYQDRGRMEQARDLYARAAAKAPDNAELLNNIGSWHYAQGEFDEARRYWLRAASADAKYPSPLNNLAGLEINARRLDEAERLLRRALELDPSYGDARINLAIVRTMRDDAEGALAELRRATADPRTGATSWQKLGALELELGHLPRAIEALDHARSLDPSRTETLNYLGEAHRRQGNADRALALWRESLALDPRQEQLRRALEQLEQGTPSGTP
jgi:Tfp pilus assembly protein PilF/predicted AlkP superfamily phosphohydrolase/phosphomutase